MRLQTIIILSLTLAGFALRLYYATTTHPFFDEYTTVLAARQILQYGWPVLPSGLFYEHGLLATYIIAPFTALFINTPLDNWQAAHWGLRLARWPSTLLGTVTIPLIYAIGRQFNSQLSTVNSQWSISNLPTSISLLAAGLFALSPEGMVWGGRARMYALATLLVLLTVFWAYRGAIHPAPARYRWLAMVGLLAALLTQFGTMMLVPALVVGMVVIGWLSWRGSEEQGRFHASRTTHHAPRPWFLRPTIIPEALALAAIVGTALWVKRLGQPAGMTALDSTAGDTLATALLDTVTYQTAFAFSWPNTLNFLAEQFGPSHLFWLALITVVSTVMGLFIWLTRQWPRSVDREAWRRSHNTEQAAIPPRPTPVPDAKRVEGLPPYTLSHLFLWLIFGLILLEMVTILDPFRQNPRYLVMYLPLFYLIAARAIFDLRFLCFGLHASERSLPLGRLTPHASRLPSPILIALSLLVIFTALTLADLRIALVTPEPAYEAAFKFVRDNWQPDDALVTMNTPAAVLYRHRVAGFTAQVDADQFLLNKNSAPIDRWVGAPWIGTAADFNAALNAHPRVWFVIDAIRQPVYFRSDWQAVVNSQMEPVWRQDNALIYRTRSERMPLPTQPEILVKATLGDAIELIGYTLQIDALQPTTIKPNSDHLNLKSPISSLKLTLFWRSLRSLTPDYTVFLHLRRHDGSTVAQQDGLSLDGAYPSSRWQPGEIVIDPFTLTLPPDLPPGQYTLWAGMYQLDTLERLPLANDTSGENAILLGEINYQ